MISKDSSGFINVSEVVPDAILEMRYYSTFNFVGERIDGYNEPIAILTKEAAKALKVVSDAAIEKGYRIKIFDAYRPQRAVDHFVRWGENIDDIRMKSFFYPGIQKKDVFKEGYIALKSGHSRGSTVDLTLFDMTKGCDVDMGGCFDFFGDVSHPDYQEITAEQKEKRELLRDIMLTNGFKPSLIEWWHFTLKEEPYPDTYFDFPIERLQYSNAAM